MKTNEKAAYLQHLYEELWMNLAEEEDRFKEYGLSSTVEVLLTTVIRMEKPTSSQLAKKLSITKSAVSQMISKLEEDGFIIKLADPDDKRIQRIGLGHKGEAYARDLEQYDSYVYNLFANSLSDEELTHTAQSFEKILRNLHQKADA
ncbi:MarR family transcriptional regulator [Pontibacillus chungwhensis BH030062]|uniref:MarR family transcriptional regulator n=1 Tax=Pontibacillus chungwhensis BH030062 TaxID=1385513 RepID=A0A0A2UR42_9BACI|nr:MarR family transcriptional regulator [Pontibacillus chungwhensis]KGP90374.1 MarR family transcriptional regulator [Pontibacillus chungwhensis BH030062]